jgi:hypothetical protein
VWVCLEGASFFAVENPDIREVRCCAWV